jgi:predicted  nucleic acid-binding Zn-ribbon protein
MESLKEKLWRWQKKIKEQQDSINKELYPVFKEIEDLQKKAIELQIEFNKLWYREW